MNQFNLKLYNLLLAFLIITIILFSHSLKADNIKLIIKINDDTMYGDMTKNKIIGTGFISNREGKKVIIGSGSERVNGSHGVYLFRGSNNPLHYLKVKIGGNGWVPDKSGLGIVSNSDLINKFYIYYYGNDYVPVDTYYINLYASEFES